MKLPRWLKGFLPKSSRVPEISEDVIPDPLQRAVHEEAIAHAMKTGKPVLATYGPEGVTVDGVTRSDAEFWYDRGAHDAGWYASPRSKDANYLKGFYTTQAAFVDGDEELPPPQAS